MHDALTRSLRRLPPRMGRARTLGRIIAETLECDGRSRLIWLAEIGLLGAVGLLVLIGIDRGLATHAAGRPDVGAILLFGLAVLVNRQLEPRVNDRALAALGAVVGRRVERVVDGLWRLDYEQFESIGRAEIAGRIGEDVDRIVPSSRLLVQAAVGAVTVVLVTAYIAQLSPRAAVICAVMLIALALLTLGAGRVLAEQVARDRADGARLDAMVADLIAGFAQVKQHRPRSDDLARAFDAAATALYESRDAHFSAYYARDAASRQAFFLLMGLVAFVLPHFVPEVASEIGRLVVAVTFVLTPMTLVMIAATRLMGVVEVWQRLDALAERVVAMGAAAPPPEAPGEAEAAAFTGLSLAGVCFRYPASDERVPFDIGPLDLTLAPGEILFITGANGSGKSTLINLLCGLYRRHDGELRLGDRTMPIDPGPLWRELFSPVFAEFVLFERLYGHEDADPARVAALLAEFELDGTVHFADGRFDTVELSTGQRKRLALVIALLRDRPVFVFDEWAADQDPHFRTRFYRQILPMLRARGKAVIAVTHDDDAFDACDRRVHLVDGRIEARLCEHGGGEG